MKNRNKKIIFSIIIILIAIFGFVGANQLNGILTSKVTPKDEIVLSNDNKKNTNVSNDVKQDETKANEENQNPKSDNKEDNSKENKTSKEISSEKQNDNKQVKEQNNEAKFNQVKNNSNININKSKNTNNEQEKLKSKKNNNTKTTQNEIKKQVVHLSIIDSINNKTLFCGQVSINSNENFNTIMNKFFYDNGVRHINRGGYISMMYGLSEFSKGPNSGWCYYINGNKASVGILGYTPKNGDRIVWKYLKDGVNK